MNFDPTFNYGLLNLKIENNLVCWKFGELIKTLITISSSSERQMEIIGGGMIADEMAEDFHTYYTLSCSEFQEYELLDAISTNKLNYLDIFLEMRSGDKDIKFWDDTKLSTNADWKNLRIQAEEILNLLGFKNLDIYLDKTDKNFVHKILFYKDSND